MRDFDRPLDAQGRLDAEAMGRVLRNSAHVPDLVLCSGAKRARETLAGLAATGPQSRARVVFLDALYHEDAAGYLDIIRERGSASNVMLVIGHNPMMEDLAMALAAEGRDHSVEALAAGFPPAGLAVIDLDCGFADAAPGCGNLAAFLVPSDV